MDVYECVGVCGREKVTVGAARDGLAADRADDAGAVPLRLRLRSGGGVRRSGAVPHLRVGSCV